MNHTLRLGAATAALLAGLGFAAAADGTGQAADQGAMQAPTAAAPAAPTNTPAPAGPDQAVPIQLQGPIGATPSTMPAKFSAANAAKDKIPLSAQPLHLNPAQKQTLLAAIDHDPAPRTTVGAGGNATPFTIQVGALLPEGITPQEIPPEATDAIPQLKGHQYVTVHDRIWIVDPLRDLVTEGIAR